MVLASVDCSLRAAYVLLATFSELLLALLDAADSLHLSRRLKALHLRKPFCHSCLQSIWHDAIPRLAMIRNLCVPE